MPPLHRPPRCRKTAGAQENPALQGSRIVRSVSCRLFTLLLLVQIPCRKSKKDLPPLLVHVTMDPEASGPSEIFREVNAVGTEKERKDTQKALLYDLRLIFSHGEKETYTKEEIVELLDKIAMAKDQE